MCLLAGSVLLESIDRWFFSSWSSFFSEIYWQMCAQVGNITLIEIDISYIYIL